MTEEALNIMNIMQQSKTREEDQSREKRERKKNIGDDTQCRHRGVIVARIESILSGVVHVS
jgi:hypothetical protein